MKNLYDSNKLVIILYESQHTYHAKYLGKMLSFSDDVCVPVPRYKHFHFFEHDGLPAMWNSWFLEDGVHKWLEYGWHEELDFAQKQGYLNTYRTPEVEKWLESTEFGVFAIKVDALNNSTLHEICLIFPRAWMVCISESRKLKTPFMLNQLVTIVPDQVSPYDVQWVHGIDQWISNRHQVMRLLNNHLNLNIDQGEAQAFFNKTSKTSSGYWGRKLILRFTLEPESQAMMRLEVDGIMMHVEKLKLEKDFYFSIIERQPITTIRIHKEHQSHAIKFDPIMIKSFEINDQLVSNKGTFYPKPHPMTIRQYNSDELQPKRNWQSINCDGYWEIKTDGINML